MTKENKKPSRPRAKGDQEQSKTPSTESLPIELEKSIGVLPCILGRLPIFLPLLRAKRLEKKTKLYFDDELSFVGQNKEIKEIYADGYLLTTQEEDLLLFLLRKAVKQGNRFVRTSYSEIARVVFGEKSPNKNIRTKIYETIEHLAKSEISFVEKDGLETTIGFIADRQRKTKEDYQHPLFVSLRDVIFAIAYKGKSFYLQSISHRRKLRSPNLKKIYSFLCATNFTQISFKKIYVNCRIKQSWKNFRRTVSNPKLVRFLYEVKGCKVIVDKNKELVIFLKPDQKALPKNKKKESRNG